MPKPATQLKPAVSRGDGRPPLPVLFLWHQHQPYYKNAAGFYEMPWVRLHGLKDYFDMVARLERFPNVHQTFNLVPSLLEQICDYAVAGAVDEHWQLTEKPAAALDAHDREQILQTFFSAPFETMVKPNVRYRELYILRDNVRRGLASIDRFGEEDWRDLQMWSNLAWVDPILRNEEPWQEFFTRQRGFTEDDKTRMLTAQRALLSAIIPKHRQLAEAGQIEICVSPYFHPILPLLCDTNVARQSLPHATLPDPPFTHPDDAAAQVTEAVRLAERLFGSRPRGMWPSEGSVSPAIVPILADAGVEWIATDEEVHRLSLGLHGAPTEPVPHGAKHPHRFEHDGRTLSLVFRDHRLSDRIGFVYSGWDGERAAEDFVGHLLRQRESMSDCAYGDVCAPIILDGENAWEFFPNDGDEFLTALYTHLEEDDRLQAMTVSEFLDLGGARPTLPALWAGSWIDANFQIWIGHRDDVAAWDMVRDAREALVNATAAATTDAKPSTPVDLVNQVPMGDESVPSLSAVAAAWKQLYIAEGSDWCWWYGEENRGAYNAVFDRIFRGHLIALYELIDRPIPPALLHPIASGGEESWIRPPAGLMTPTIDGRTTDYYEWWSAGEIDCRRAGGAMHMAEQHVRRVLWGLDQRHIYFRLEFSAEVHSEQVGVRVEFRGTDRTTLIRDPNGLHWSAPDDHPSEGQEASGTDGTIWEAAVPLNEFVRDAASEFEFCVVISERRSAETPAGTGGDRDVERWPPTDLIAVHLPKALSHLQWSV